VNSACVYRAYDETGALLYVGCSGRLLARLDQHRGNKPWWSEVRHIDVQQFDSRDDALEAESAAIASESPRYNADLHASAERAWKTRRLAQEVAHKRGVFCNVASCSRCARGRAYEASRAAS